MAETEQKPPNNTRRKDIITIILLIALLVSFGASYYVVMLRNETIHDLNERIVELETNLAGQRARVRSLETTIDEMEAAQAGGAVEEDEPATRRGQPLEYDYEAGVISEAWRNFQSVRRNVQQMDITDEAFAELVATDDLNGVRGPDLGEIQCFEQLIGPEGSPYLRTIFESNVDEVRFSKDIGTAANFMPGLENLLAFYVTLGEPQSLMFLEEFLTTGPAAQMAQTRFKGNYFTYASDLIVSAIEDCLDEGGGTPEETEEGQPEPDGDTEAEAEPDSESTTEE